MPRPLFVRISDRKTAAAILRVYLPGKILEIADFIEVAIPSKKKTDQQTR